MRELLAKVLTGDIRKNSLSGILTVLFVCAFCSSTLAQERQNSDRDSLIRAMNDNPIILPHLEPAGGGEISGDEEVSDAKEVPETAHDKLDSKPDSRKLAPETEPEETVQKPEIKKNDADTDIYHAEIAGKGRINPSAEEEASVLSADEYELFESMKTKMFLLEREKEALRKELMEIRQKEIEVMKTDIGCLQKTEDQAGKIRILEEKLKNTNE